MSMPNRPSDVSFSNPVVGARDDPSRREMIETSWLRYATDTEDSDGTIQPPPREYEEYVEDGQDGRHEEPHRSAGFWDPRMDKVRREVATNWLRTLLMLMTFILAVLSMYWGVLTHIDGNLHNLVIYVVDFDGQVAPYDDVTPLVGPTVTEIAQQVIDSPEKRKLGYTIVSPDEFGYDPIAVRQAVYDWHCWAAIIVNPNATALLQQAVATGNSSYDPTGAIQFITQSARQETTTINYIVPLMNVLATQFSGRFGPMWTQNVMSNSSLDRDVIAQAPAALSPGVTPLSIDLRPFGPATATPTVSIGLIYLIIVAFFSFAFFLPIHMQLIVPKGHPPLRFWQLIVWRLFAAITTYFLVSLIYSFVSLAFQIPFSNPPASPTEPAINPTAYGRGSFVVYWMVNFIGMCALGLACENMGIIIGQPWTAGWLIFWVITNVSTAFYAIELAPGFFRWGYAWPLHHIVQASRSILFDLHSEIGLNFGVLFAWVAVNITLFPICCYIGRWKQENGQRNAERASESYTVYDARAEGQKKVVPKEKGALPPVRKRGFMRGV
ncbi:MNNG and nitrosoguanidine resistance protein [Daldinia vernicosa]|uniref:MNNG and nitrosoguanidine resistance protein n=1 Tax=Daldinia vernicosa TaxID=114800 RepID=UPI002007350A|nr:MNNG and nitrosoguanidine resistance protein [Daldinia vernicosa]KAI0846612.1 MNNG and nitrosoguanidine resistance protein [Daldinia vernicosa]